MTQEYLPAGNVRRYVPSRKAIVTASIFVSLLGLALVWLFTGRESLAQPAKKIPQNLIVRGYIAAAVGQSNDAEKSGLFSRTVAGKDIYLPGVEVFLTVPGTGKPARTAKTDLSGRFTLHAPDRGRYLICWNSSLYGDGCAANFINAGSEPLFVSTIRIQVPRLADHVAVMGHVTSADGALPRTFEPLLNINAFATVNLEDEKGGLIATAYVNNFGDYLLPHVPTRTKIRLTAGIEAARFTQEVWPEAQIETAPLHQVNLKFENHRPRLDPVVAFGSVGNNFGFSSRPLQNAAPGSTINVVAQARDRDGDPVEFAWFVDPADGVLSGTRGSTVQWKLPAARGRSSLTVVAYDGKGGYDKAVFSVNADERGVPFTGSVVTPTGAPVANAAIEIVGNAVVMTDARGRFQTNVNEADRYVFNVRKEGFALNSRVYDRGVTGGRWILRPAQLITINPTRNVAITHQRSERDCPGPESARAGLGAAGQSLTIPQWQDGKGNVTDAPSWWSGLRSVAQLGKRNIGVSPPTLRASPPSLGERQPVILSRDLKLPACGPGITVEIPANSILDASGKLATAPIKVAIATIDLLSSQQMPGDDTVVPAGGNGAYLKSYGAGSLDLPSGFKLKPGASAKITIPVDRSRLIGGTLPATVPLLSYNEQKGLWEEEDKLTMSVRNGVRIYSGTVKHFTIYNADTFFTNAACLRVFSPSLPGSYNLEVMSPYPDGTPHYKNYPIDNVASTEHVIFNITPNANMTLAPMTSGSAPPQLLGFYIVNSGGPETPPHSPSPPPGPPYTSCNNFVVLTVDSAPNSPSGGEFLHGLGFFDAANLGFDDLTAALPTGNALRDAIVLASRAYYAQVDPNPDRDTFAKFKTKHGFDQDPNVSVSGEVVAQYANSGDLGFGRDMHCLKKGNGDVACYVTNYGTGYTNIYDPNAGGGPGTTDQDDADAAGQRNTVGLSKEVATVAMEYSPIENDASGVKVVKFFVYKKNFPNAGDYGRSISANLDGRGERPVPQLCMTCHGGALPQQSGGTAVFGTADDVKLGSRFLPFDHRFFTFPSTPASLSKANQEASIKALNEQIVNAAPPAAASDPIAELISAMYNNSATQISNVTVAGWVNGASANAPNQASFYQGVLAPACRTCHVAQPYPQLQFNTSDKFLNLSNAVTANNKLMLGTAQLRVCGDYVMAHALRTHEIFWNEYWDASWGTPPSTSFPAQFQNFGDGVGGSTWKAALCTSFVSGTVSSPSNFYEQSIQPIWNGKCVACHIGGGAASFFPLTQGVSFNQLLIPPAPALPRVVPGNDNPAAAGNTLLDRITRAGPGGGKMPQNCIQPPTPPPAGKLPCLEQADIAKIKAWIRSGAN